jgi:ribosomal protein S6
MPALTPEYELVLMLDPETPDERRDAIAADARKRIESGGSLKHDTAWGMRKMAYEIRQRTEADYRFFRFETGDSLLDELNHNLKIADGVLRFRIFKVDPRNPVIVPPPPSPLSSGRPERGGRRDGPRGRGGDRPPPGGPGEADSEPVAAPVAPVEPVATEQAPASESPAAPEAPAAPPPDAPAAPTEEPPAAPEPEAPAEEPAAAAPEETAAAEPAEEAPASDDEQA